jgi:hypothetical protein
MKTNKGTAKAVIEYAIRYASNVGLQPVFPRLVVGMMRELPGWPVRNADGGTNIAYFETEGSANAAISAARRAFRSAFDRDWSAS